MENSKTNTIEKPFVNQYALIISIAILIYFVHCNINIFSNNLFAKITISLLLIFEFLFIAGTMEMINKGTYFYKISLYSVFTYILYRGFIDINNDLIKFILIAISIIPLHNIIRIFLDVIKEITSLNKARDKFKNAFLFIANLTTFILAIVQILDIINKK